MDVHITFKVFLFVTFGGLIPFVYIMCTFNNVFSKLGPEDYTGFTQYSDFKLTALSSIFFFFSHQFAIWLLPQYVAPLCKVQVEGEEKEKRVKKMASQVYRLTFFLGSSIWGYSILKDADFLPVGLGGTGEFSNIFKTFPYTNHEPGLANYLVVTMGYHFAAIASTMMEPTRSDYLEMMLHHSSTVFLYGGSYISNHLEGGACIAFLHDLADITTSLVKFVGESCYPVAAVIVMTCHIALWGWTRNYIFPQLIYDIVKDPFVTFTSHSSFIKPYYVYLLSCLCLLHYYWMGLFISMMVHYAKTGKATDTQQNIKVQVEIERKKKK